MSLCPEFEMRARMTDDEFWEHVLNRPRWDVERTDGEAFWPYNDDERDTDAAIAEPCPECGECSACGFDPEGRAYIHVTPESDR